MLNIYLISTTEVVLLQILFASQSINIVKTAAINAITAQYLQSFIPE